jgi:hypothetical protein
MAYLCISINRADELDTRVNTSEMGTLQNVPTEGVVAYTISDPNVFTRNKAPKRALKIAFDSISPSSRKNEDYSHRIVKESV